MSGYRCVNYYELCRLCTASQGTKKVHIFSEEAKKTNLLEKILGCLPIVVSLMVKMMNSVAILNQKWTISSQIRENDKLPKIVCAQCLSQVESTIKFRESCMNAQTMLESCLNSSKLRNGEKVWIIIFLFVFRWLFHLLRPNCANMFRKGNVLKFSRFISRMWREKSHHPHRRNWSKRYRMQRPPRQWWKQAFHLPLARRHWPKLQYKRIPIHLISWVVLFKQLEFR